jgi:PAS domain S-box-containing protein
VSAVRRPVGTPSTLEAVLGAVRCVAWTVALPSLRTLYVSANSGDVLGHPAGAFEDADSWHRMIHPDDRERRMRVARDAVARGEGFESEYRIVRADGGVRWVHDSAGIVRNDAGEAVELHGMTRDVTARREQDERFRYGAERMELAMRLAGVVTWEWNATTDCIHTDPHGHLLMDSPSDEDRRMAVDFVARIHPDDRERLRRVGEATLASGVPCRTIFRMLKPGGAVRYVETYGVARGDGVRNHTLVGASRDVTDEHLALRDAQLRARLLDSLGEGVSVATSAGTLVYVNAALERMFGYDPGELVGRDIRVLSSRRPEAYDRRVVEMIAKVDARGHWSGAMTSRRKDGSSLSTHGTITRVMVDGESHWLTVRQDMTERHRVQRDVLDASQREKEDLAHELHEGLGQQLAGVALLARSLRDAAEKSGSAPSPSLQRLCAILVEAVGTCRRLAQGVAGFSVRHGGLSTGLRELALRFERRYGAICSVDADPEVAARLSPERARQLYWIADEGLALAGHHGAAGAGAGLRLDLCDEAARLGVRATGLTPERLDEVGGTSLRTLGYRAALLGAVVATRATPAGVVIECLCPLDEGTGVSP